jgi:hypothetical protein
MTAMENSIIAQVIRDSEDGAVWLQQAGESDKKYRLFHDYLLLGPARSLPQIYTIHRERGEINTRNKSGFINLDKSYRTMTVEFNWVERAKAFDEWNYQHSRIRHVQLLNEALEVLFNGAKDAATTLVKATTNAAIVKTQIQASCAVLDRCGIVSRGSGYEAPSAINRVQQAETTTRIVVELRNSTKSELEALASDDD